MHIDPGAMRHRVRFERRMVTPDPDYGTEVITWMPLATVWVQLLDELPSKAESQDTGIRVASRPARLRGRWRTDLTSDMRVVVLNPPQRTMKIVSGPAMLGNSQYFEIMAEEYSTAGDAA